MYERVEMCIYEFRMALVVPEGGFVCVLKAELHRLYPKETLLKGEEGERMIGKQGETG